MRRAVQRQAERGAEGKRYISRSIDATRQAYGLTDQNVTYRDYSGDAATTRAAGRRRTGRRRRTSGCSTRPSSARRSPSSSRARTSTRFPDQLAIDRYLGHTATCATTSSPRANSTRTGLIDEPARLDQPAHRLHPRQRLHRLAGQHGRGVANDPNQNGGYPEFLASVVGANGSVVVCRVRRRWISRASTTVQSSPTRRRLRDRRHGSGADREYDYETNTETKNYTYTGRGGVPIGNWLTRQVFAAKFAERNFLFSNVIGDEQQDPVQPRSGRARRGGGAVADHRHQRLPGDREQEDGVDRRRLHHAGQLPVLAADDAVERPPPTPTRSRVNRLPPDKQVSYIRNSVKATVDAYDGTVTLYAQDEHDPVLQAWMKVFPGTVKPKSDISPELRRTCATPRTCSRCSAQLLAKYHVDDPVTFFSTSDFWDVPLDPNPTASSYQPPYYIVAKDLAANDSSASFQLTSAMNRFRARLPGRLHQCEFRPGHLRQDHRADHPRSGQRSEVGVQRDQHRHRGEPGPRRDRARQPEPHQVGQPADAAGRPGGLLYVAPVYASPGASDAASSYPRLHPRGDDVQRQGRLRTDGA